MTAKKKSPLFATLCIFNVKWLPCSVTYKKEHSTVIKRLDGKKVSFNHCEFWNWPKVRMHLVMAMWKRSRRCTCWIPLICHLIQRSLNYSRFDQVSCSCLPEYVNGFSLRFLFFSSVVQSLLNPFLTFEMSGLPGSVLFIFITLLFSSEVVCLELRLFCSSASLFSIVSCYFFITANGHVHSFLLLYLVFLENLFDRISLTGISLKYISH